MIKAKSVGEKNFLIFICGFCFFLFSCGLESIVYLEPPRSDGHTASLTDPVLSYFSFITANDENSSADGIDGFKYLGTAVYYKIYGDYNKLISERSSIDSLNSSSTTNTAAASLRDRFNFKSFNLLGSRPEVLISKESSIRYVYIRPNDLVGNSGINSDYAADVRVGSSKIDNSTKGASIGFPMRNTSQNNGFDLGATGKGSFGCIKSDSPVESDDDVDGSAVDSGVWYVAAYAFSAGRDGSFQESYSKVLYLGEIKITESDYNNK